MSSIEKSQIVGDRIFTLSNVLNESECAAWIALGERFGFTAAPITTGAGFRMAPQVRNNTRAMFDDASRSQALWERLRGYVPDRLGELSAVGLNERLRLYRYTPQQYFRWHRDGAFVRSSEEYSLYTLMLYLNQDVEGGETQFDTRTGELSVVPERGMALLFEHRLTHQGAPVLRGTKYVLRTDVMYRAPSRKIL